MHGIARKLAKSLFYQIKLKPGRIFGAVKRNITRVGIYLFTRKHRHAGK